MEIPDQKIIETIQSRVVSQEEFNYDRLNARPLYSLLSQNDIDELYRIATSRRLSGNPRKRYELIDKVMHNRGFRKLSAGTNRVAYTYFEDPSIVIKVAADKTAIMDNPREFVNQHKLKPFCTKVFEVDPSGTVGVFERVKPITSREEYLTVASDVFEMLDLLTAKYVLADIGTKFFMNIGTRKGFGVVLLDFPYLYEINDPNSLVCKKPDPNSPGGFCGGLIDYDEGFNTLRCNKCGAIYRAQELGSYLKTNKIIMRGDRKMEGVKVSFVRNGKVYSANTSDIMKEEAKAIQHIPEKKETNSVDNNIKVNVTNGDKKYSFNIEATNDKVQQPAYNFKTNRINKAIDRINNSVNKDKDNNRYKAFTGRFSKLNKFNNLVFTIKINDKIYEVVVDPNRIPDYAKLVIIPDFENLSEVTKKLELAKSDILKLEDTNSDLNNKIKELEEELERCNNSNQVSDTSKDDKIRELEEANTKLAEAEAEASDKVSELEQKLNEKNHQDLEVLENIKQELIKSHKENEELRSMLDQYNESNADISEEETENDTIEEEVVKEDEENEYMTNSAIYINAVRMKLSDLINIANLNTDYTLEDGTEIDKDAEVTVFKDYDGYYLTDSYNNMFVGLDESSEE